jgi:hypothetical protein
MVRLGLIAPPDETAVTTLATLVELYFEQKQHANKSSTRTNIEIVANNLYGFFGRDLDVTTVTATSVVRFLTHYKERKLAASTVARRLRLSHDAGRAKVAGGGSIGMALHHRSGTLRRSAVSERGVVAALVGHPVRHREDDGNQSQDRTPAR